MAEARDAAGVAGEHDASGENAGYEAEAMAVLEAIALNTRRVLILNTANRTALPFLDARAVSRSPRRRPRRPGAACRRRRTGPRARPRGAMKDVERTTIEAALTGSRALAIRSLALHPLVPSVTTAREIFDGYRARLPVLRARFPA